MISHGVTILAIILSMAAIAQPFDRLVYEYAPSSDTNGKFSIDKTTLSIALWTTQIRGTWQHKDSASLDVDAFAEVVLCLDSIVFENIPDTSRGGFDGTWYHLELWHEGAVVKRSSVWSPYAKPEHDALLRILVTQFQGHFHDVEVSDFISRMLTEYE